MKNYGLKGKNILESKPVLVLLGIIILIFAWTVVRFGFKMAETGRNKELVAEKTTALLAQKENLTADIAKLKTDRGKEEFVRENFGLAKVGEEVIVIVEDNTPAPPHQSRFSGFFSFLANWLK